MLKTSVFYYMLLLVCMSGVCQADEHDTVKAEAEKLKVVVQSDLEVRDKFNSYESRLKNVESSNLYSIVDAVVFAAKASLNFQHRKLKCKEVAVRALDGIQANANQQLNNNDNRFSDITTPEDQQYYQVLGDQVSAGVSNLLDACNRPSLKSECNSSTLSELREKENKLSRALGPVKEAVNKLDPFNARVNEVLSEYERCN